MQILLWFSSILIELDRLLKTIFKLTLVKFSSTVLHRRLLILGLKMAWLLNSGFILCRDVWRRQDLFLAAGHWRLVYMLLGFHDDCGFGFLAASDVGQAAFDLLADLAASNFLHTSTVASSMHIVITGRVCFLHLFRFAILLVLIVDERLKFRDLQVFLIFPVIIKSDHFREACFRVLWLSFSLRWCFLWATRWLPQEHRLLLLRLWCLFTSSISFTSKVWYSTSRHLPHQLLPSQLRLWWRCPQASFFLLLTFQNIAWYKLNELLVENVKDLIADDLKFEGLARQVGLYHLD